MNDAQPSPLHQIDALAQSIATFLSTEAKGISVTGDVHETALKLIELVHTAFPDGLSAVHQQALRIALFYAKTAEADGNYGEHTEADYIRRQTQGLSD